VPLAQLTGIEYALFYSDEQEGLFVIRKQLRESPETVIPQATYYIIQGWLAVGIHS